MDALISVIIPVYNTEQYLERCLDSVLNNTYRNLEVICIDDGSTDRSLEVLRRYEASDPRVIVISKENGGVSSARNAGLDRMTGEYVTFIDSDDFVHPQYVEILLSAQQISGADIIVGKFKSVQKDCVESVDYPQLSIDLSTICVSSPIEACKLTSINAGCSSRLIPLHIIAGTRFRTDSSYGEDTLFSLELFSNNPLLKIGIIDSEIYYYYQGRTDSLVKRGRDQKIVRFFSVIADLSSAKEKEKIYLEVLMRRGLFFRYYYTYIQKERVLAKGIGKVLRSKLRQLQKSKNFSLKYKAYWTLFVLSPSLERLHRFYRNPSLRLFERIQIANAKTRNSAISSRSEIGVKNGY